MFCLIAAEPEAAGVIRANLRKAYPDWRVETVTDVREIESRGRERPDVVLLSRFLPGLTTEALQHLPALFPASRIVLLVGEYDEACRGYLGRAEKIGLVNYVTGKLPGDRPYTVMAALLYDRPEVVGGGNTGTQAPIRTGLDGPDDGSADLPSGACRRVASSEETHLAGPTAGAGPAASAGREPAEARPWDGRQIRAGRRGALVVVAANKGGVGKTTTVITLGFALAAAGIKVALVDLNWEGISLSAFFEAKPPGIEALRGHDPARVIDRVLRDTRCPNLMLLPGLMDRSILPETLFARGELAAVTEALLHRFPVVVADTPSNYWTRPWLPEVFALADRVLAVVDQSAFSEKDTELYAPYLLMMGVEPQKIGIVLNRFSPRLHNARKVEAAFCAGFREDVPKSILPRVIATIPHDWDAYVMASYRGEPAGLDDPRSQWHRLAGEIAALAGERYERPAEKKKGLLGFLGREK